MKVDHSLTYRLRSPRNWGHIARRNAIFRILANECSPTGRRYADVGCSNGFVTALIHDRFEPRHTTGLDFEQEYLEEAARTYPRIQFEWMDLNEPRLASGPAYDVVTCFETLEHVGNLGGAVDNLIALTAPDGRLLISVPMEVGLVGIVKFVAKMVFFGYSVRELSREKNFTWKYFRSLVKGNRMSEYRDSRPGWGTHFGFDYRDLDDALEQRNVQFRAFNRYTTRFYVVCPNGAGGRP